MPGGEAACPSALIGLLTVAQHGQILLNITICSNTGCITFNINSMLFLFVLSVIILNNTTKKLHVWKYIKRKQSKIFLHEFTIGNQ